MNFEKNSIPVTTTDIEIPPTQEIQTVPGQEVKDIKKETPVLDSDIFQAKMTSTTVVTHQTVETKPVTKLPEIEKKRPAGGVDPYREPII